MAVPNRGILGAIERIGNRMPHPIGLFLGIIVIVLVLSAVLSMFGVSAVHPQTKQVLPVENMLSVKALTGWMTNLSKNLQNFPVLASVLILAAATGLCEQTGFFSAAIKASLKNARGWAVVFSIALVGACGNAAGDVSFLIVPTIAASIFQGTGRNPLVGLFMGYATVGGGYGTNFIPGGWDVILTPITIQAAKLLDPGFDMNLVSGYFMMVVGTVVIAATSTFVTLRYIEPKLGTYRAEAGDAAAVATTDQQLTPEQSRALRKAVLALVILLGAIVVACIPENSFMRSPAGSLTINAPLMQMLYAILVAAFMLPGLVYGIAIGKITNLKDFASLLTSAISAVAPFIVIALFVSQFLYLFAQSNLGSVLAINGGNMLKGLSIPVLFILILFFLMEGFADLFIVSGSSRYLIFGPVFVPMLMQLGVHPAFVQMIHRTGGSICNHLSPLNSFFPVLLSLAQKYDRNIGIGTIFSVMIPYTIAFAIVYIVLLSAWFLSGLPIGFDTLPVFSFQH
jgi:aminobenzoyl-glutamate transport protein